MSIKQIFFLSGEAMATEPPTLTTHIRGNSVMPLNINILNRVNKPCNVSMLTIWCRVPVICDKVLYQLWMNVTEAARPLEQWQWNLKQIDSK